MKLLSVLNILGWTLLLFSGAMAGTAVGGIAFGEVLQGWKFLQSAALVGFFAGCMVLSTRGRAGEFGKHESYVFVVLVWPLLAVAGAMPIYLTTPHFGFFPSYFEAVSGLTTTGATMFDLPDAAPGTVLLWRALMQWLGGFLSIVLVVVILTHLNIGGLEIFQNALPSGEGRALSARLAQTAKDLSLVYVIITFLCALALFIAGMSGFDAICHALSTISTGGFSTRFGGIASYNNGWIELVLIIFMLVASLNFTLHWGLFQGRWWNYARNREARYLIYVLIASLLIFAVFLFARGSGRFDTDLRDGTFAIVSMISTTGYFSTSDLRNLPVPVVMFGLLVALGGATGSTTGGLKLLRLAILLKHALRELQRLSHPHGVVSVKFGRRRLTENAIGSIWAYFFLLILVLAGLTLVVSLTGVDTDVAMSASLAALSNAGPFLELIAPSGYFDLPLPAQVYLTVGMILGADRVVGFFHLD